MANNIRVLHSTNISYPSYATVLSYPQASENLHILFHLGPNRPNQLVNYLRSSPIFSDYVLITVTYNGDWNHCITHFYSDSDYSQAIARLVLGTDPSIVIIISIPYLGQTNECVVITGTGWTASRWLSIPTHRTIIVVSFLNSSLLLQNSYLSLQFNFLYTPLHSS